MTKYIPLDSLVAEIEKLVDKGKYHDEYDYAYRDGNNGALYALKNKLDTLEVKEVQGEAVSEDLEEAAKNHAVERFRTTRNEELAEKCKWSFKTGAKWQKTKDESTTEDLGEYINELSKQFPEVSFAKLSRIAVRVAKWQKQQMMKEAVEVPIEEAVPFGSCKWKLCAKLWLDKGVKGNKVKLIIIKED